MAKKSLKKLFKKADKKLHALIEKIPQRTAIIIIITFLFSCGALSLYYTFVSVYRMGSKKENQVEQKHEVVEIAPDAAEPSFEKPIEDYGTEEYSY